MCHRLVRHRKQCWQQGSFNNNNKKESVGYLQNYLCFSMYFGSDFVVPLDVGALGFIQVSSLQFQLLWFDLVKVNGESSTTLIFKGIANSSINLPFSLIPRLVSRLSLKPCSKPWGGPVKIWYSDQTLGRFLLGSECESCSNLHEICYQ